MTSSGYADPIAISKKTIIYVGGLDEAVDESVLGAAFRPFGDLQQVLVPKDANSQKHRGFGFVEFIDPEDAVAALENMNESELYGRVLKCNLAKPSSVQSGAIWAGEQADAWYGSQQQSGASIDAAIAHQQNLNVQARAKQ